ncbi:hypothetical protein J2Y67_000070 [Neobacillus niacini]|nr:hypothetical protein [Neobacillus niacini]
MNNSRLLNNKASLGVITLNLNEEQEMMRKTV